MARLERSQEARRASKGFKGLQKLSNSTTISHAWAEWTEWSLGWQSEKFSRKRSLCSAQGDHRAMLGDLRMLSLLTHRKDTYVCIRNMRMLGIMPYAFTSRANGSGLGTC